MIFECTLLIVTVWCRFACAGLRDVRYIVWYNCSSKPRLGSVSRLAECARPGLRVWPLARNGTNVIRRARPRGSLLTLR